MELDVLTLWHDRYEPQLEALPMSCLMLSELPLSEQIAIELTHAANLQVLAVDVFTVLDLPVKKAASLDSLPLDAGGSDSLTVTEQAA
ncbi:MAG: hypothetical protein WA777_19655 [Rhodanobacter sp.]